LFFAGDWPVERISPLFRSAEFEGLRGCWEWRRRRRKRRAKAVNDTDADHDHATA
jgi:hypothetical protein